MIFSVAERKLNEILIFYGVVSILAIQLNVIFSCVQAS
jgi:hypothetical protein